MKKTVLLNIEISEVIASMGHGDELVIGDAGLPIPPEARRIDLAVTKDLPGFIDTVKAICTELQVEEVLIAAETKDISSGIDAQLVEIFDGVKITYVTHEELKEHCVTARAVVRTGEFTPYANVVLSSGVVF
jgi:D-ribose pyranase